MLAMHPCWCHQTPVSSSIGVLWPRNTTLRTHGEMKLVTAAFRGWQRGARFAEAYMSLDKRPVSRGLLQQIAG